MRSTAKTRNNELAQLRTKLLALRASITSDGRENLQVLVAPDNLGVEDQVVIVHDQFVALTRHATNRQTLGLITAALDRFDAGEYGMCADCGDEIPLKRLQAVPWAALCVGCQERFETAPQSDPGDLLLTA